MNDVPFSVSLSLELKKHVYDYTRELKTVFLLKRKELKPNCTLFIEILISLAIILFAIPCSIFSTAKFITLFTLKAVGMVLSNALGIIPVIGAIISLIYSICFALIECIFNILSIVLYIIPLLLTNIGVNDNIDYQ